MKMKVPNNEAALRDKQDKSRSGIVKTVLLICLSILSMVGCSTTPIPTRSGHIGEPGPPGGCAAFFATLDERVRAASAIDPGLFRVVNYPYLRTDRFTASFAGEEQEPAVFEAWVDRMQALDRDARRHEIANLPDGTVETLDPADGRAGILRKVAACGDLLRRSDFNEPEQRRKLLEQVAAPDEYILFQRVAGLYPLVGLLVSGGVSRWHAEARQHFSNDPPVGWETVRYVPGRSAGRKTPIRSIGSAARDALGIPVWSPAQREALFRMYAPVWEVQTHGDYDRIGKIAWNDRAVLSVDTGRPTTYTLLSFTRYQKQILTQLNYIIWFPARPKEGAWDMYGGFLDGINYRVTLDGDAKPLLYETVHNCGCYYKAYPTERLRVRETIDYREPPLILSPPNLDHSASFIALAMRTGTHSVQRLYSLSRDMQQNTVAYSLADYGQLRSLPYADGDRRSMFDPNGLVPGSQRLERFLFWPTGVVSPGSMRQWGRHAVAFVGRRHFDDPDYMDRMFTEP